MPVGVCLSVIMDLPVVCMCASSWVCSQVCVSVIMTCLGACVYVCIIMGMSVGCVHGMSC